MSAQKHILPNGGQSPYWSNSTGAAEVSATDRPQMATAGEQNEGPTRSAVTPTDEPASSTDEDHSLERSLSQEDAVTESAEVGATGYIVKNKPVIGVICTIINQTQSRPPPCL